MQPKTAKVMEKSILRALGRRGRRGSAPAHVLEAGLECADDGGQGLEEGDESGRGHGARAHGTDVSGPQIAGAHLRDGHGAGIDRRGQPLAEEVEQGHQHQPGEDAAGENNARGFGSDDVAHAKILAGGVGLDGSAFEDVLGPEVRLELGRAGPAAEEVLVLKGGVKSAEAEAEEDAAGCGASTGARLDHVGAGRALRKSQFAVLLHDQRPPQRNHEQHAQKAADQRQHEDAVVFQVEAQENQRRQGKDDARRDGLAGVSRRLHDDRLKNRGFAAVAQEVDGDDGDGNGGGHGETGLETDVDSDAAEDNAEYAPQKNGAQGELRSVVAGRNKGLKRGHGQPPNMRKQSCWNSLKGKCTV